jgi:hypothetical protein
VSYGIKLINQQQYNGIAVKTVTSTYPQVMFVNNTFPDITMTIYPKPTRLLEWHFVSVQQLTKPATLGHRPVVSAGLPARVQVQLGDGNRQRVWCGTDAASYTDCYDVQT